MMMVLVLFIIILSIIFLWPIWMSINRRVFLHRTYFWLSPMLNDPQNQTIFGSLFYFAFGIFGILAIHSVSPIALSSIFVTTWMTNDGIILGLLRVLWESIAIFAASSSIIFLWSGLLLPRLYSKRLRGSDFRGTWMESYLKTRPIKLMVMLILLPVFVEELLFRVFVNTAILENFSLSMDLQATVVVAFLGASLFVLQQILSLKTRIQIFVIGMSSFVIAVVNGISYFLGASFYSIFIAHYIFVVFVIMSTKGNQ